MSLKDYHLKRNFSKTPEPRGDDAHSAKPIEKPRFVVHLHRATRLHYDLRLQIGSTYKSWAVPKGPSLNPVDQRLAVFVEDHPLLYGTFEGIIPPGNYGAGTVLLWDEGTLASWNHSDYVKATRDLEEGLAKGHLTFLLSGKKLSGEFALVRSDRAGANNKDWLLIKKRDQFAGYHDVTSQNRSVKSGRTLEEITAGAKANGEIWLPGAETQTFAQEDHRTTLSGTPPELAPLQQLARPKQLIKPLIPKNFLPQLWLNGPRCIVAADQTQGLRFTLNPQTVAALEKNYNEFWVELQKVASSFALEGTIEESDDPKRGKYFCVSDCLFWQGTSFKECPALERLQVLEEFFDSSTWPIALPPAVSLQDLPTLSASNAKGVLFKNPDSIYLPGITSSCLGVKLNQLAKIKLSSKEALAGGEQKSFVLTHKDKKIWTSPLVTKQDLATYYEWANSLLLPFLKDRPQSLHRHPNGAQHEGFFQKDTSGFVPSFIETYLVESKSARKSVRYMLCQNSQSLRYMINLGCIEINPWLSRISDLESSDFCVIDLDPGKSDFATCQEAAVAVRDILDSSGGRYYLKTSGASGLHFYIPVGPSVSFETCRNLALEICKRTHEKLPTTTTLERNPLKRGNKLYLDYLQNRRGQTMAAPYCVRPRELPTVSTPLLPNELDRPIDPGSFTIFTMKERLEKSQDLWKPLQQDLDCGEPWIEQWQALLGDTD